MTTNDIMDWMAALTMWLYGSIAKSVVRFVVVNMTVLEVADGD